jgi:uncharacterized membrane protein YdjX (TVP38/TMEM64 family)
MNNFVMNFIKGLFYMKFQTFIMFILYCAGMYVLFYYIIYNSLDVMFKFNNFIDAVVRDTLLIVIFIFFSLVVKNYGKERNSRGSSKTKKKTYFRKNRHR